MIPVIQKFALFVTLLLSVTFAGPAWASVGPGAGLSAIGSALALIAAVLIAIIGFVWLPARRLIRKIRARSQQAECDASEEDKAE